MNEYTLKKTEWREARPEDPQEEALVRDAAAECYGQATWFGNCTRLIRLGDAVIRVVVQILDAPPQVEEDDDD